MFFRFPWSGLINLVFPEAIIVHLSRDPLDALFSIYTHNFVDLDWVHNSTVLAQTYADYLMLMLQVESVYPKRMIHIRYATTAVRC